MFPRPEKLIFNFVVKLLVVPARNTSPLFILIFFYIIKINDIQEKQTYIIKKKYFDIGFCCTEKNCNFLCVGANTDRKYSRSTSAIIPSLSLFLSLMVYCNCRICTRSPSTQFIICSSKGGGKEWQKEDKNNQKEQHPGDIFYLDNFLSYHL